jgi:hypothetical protein
MLMKWVPGLLIASFSLFAFSSEAFAQRARDKDPTAKSWEDVRQRLAELRHDLLSISDQHLRIAVGKSRDPTLVQKLRKRLQGWIDKSPEELDSVEVLRLCHVFSVGAEPEDFRLFHRLVDRHPEYSWHVCSSVAHMVQHHGSRHAMPLLRILLENPEPWPGDPPSVEWLRKLDPSVPAPTFGDRCLWELCLWFKLQPALYGFKRVQGRLLDLVPRQELAQWKAKPGHSWDNDWIIMSEMDRISGVRKALEWLRKYTPP